MKKKLFTRVAAIMLITLLVFSLSLTVYAADRTRDMIVGDSLSLMLSDTPYVSSDPSVVEIVHKDDCRYAAVAVGKGTATITGGTWMGHDQDDYILTVYNSQFGIVFSHMGGFIIFALIILLLMIAEIIYIFIAAPKCGMSRLWALVPLFSNFFGLIVFIAVRSNRKTVSPGNNIICPTCSSVHPAGTTFCSICGTRLQ